MAWGQEKGADFHISALRACQYEIFDFVPCSLPLKTLILLTFSCFLIRRRGTATALNLCHICVILVSYNAEYVKCIRGDIERYAHSALLCLQL